MDSASEAARALARARWGTTRLDGMIAELGERRHELGEAQRAELRSVLDKDDADAREDR